MIYLELLLGFLKVGLFSFGGGYAAIPLIRDVVLSYGWLDDEMFSYMIAVSESTPGPIMVNLATYVGSAAGGLPGAFIATLAVVIPAFVIILLITALLSRIAGNRYYRAVLHGMIPCMAGIILATAAFMIFRNLFSVSYSVINLRAVLITVILAGIYFGLGKVIKKRISPIILILIAGLLGITAYTI